jgi:hypothetical protein
MYGYESSATLTTERLHYKLQTRPVLREGSPRQRAKQLPGKKKKKNLVVGPKVVPDLPSVTSTQLRGRCDRPYLSSERAPHRDKTATFRQQSSDRK